MTDHTKAIKTVQKHLDKILDTPEGQLLQKARKTVRALRKQPDDGKPLDADDWNYLFALQAIEQDQQRASGGDTKAANQKALMEERTTLWQKHQQEILATGGGRLSARQVLVLKQSYDWLLFLNDGGIAEFVQDTIMSDETGMAAVRDAFNNSYASGTSGNNCFTKVKITNGAHKVLCDYFKSNLEHIEETWFSVLSPGGETLATLKDELEKLRDKDWA